MRLNRPTFNPSLVRLAPVILMLEVSLVDPFQSQLGSIGAAVQLTTQEVRISFQSQLGSIGARLTMALLMAQRDPFNPSLVRLARGQ